MRQLISLSLGAGLRGRQFPLLDKIKSEKSAGFRPTSNMLTQKNVFEYVKKKDIDEIVKQYGETKFEKLKMSSAVCKHIFLEGMKNFRQDGKRYAQIVLRGVKNREPLTQQETLFMQKWRQDLQKLKPIYVIQILPFSGALFLLYLYTYPGSVPSWISIDKLYDEAQLEKIKKQQQAIQHFRSKNIAPDELDIHSMQLDEIRRLSELLIGYYADGTLGYKKIKKIDNLEYLGNQYISRKILLRKIKRKLKLDFVNSHILSKLSFQDQIKWKSRQIMQGKIKISHQHLHIADELAEIIQDGNTSPSKPAEDAAARQQIDSKK